MKALALSLALGLAVAVLGLTACSSDSEDAADTESPTASPTAVATPTPEPTPKPTPSPTPVPTLPPMGTRERPVPVGEPWLVDGEWVVALGNPMPNANDAIAEANMFNSPPAPGYQYFMVGVGARYEGQGSDSFDASYSLRAVGQSNVGYTTFNNSCGVVPGGNDFAEVFSGGETSTWICWQVKVEDVDSLVAYWEPFLSFTNDTSSQCTVLGTCKVFFALK